MRSARVDALGNPICISQDSQTRIEIPASNSILESIFLMTRIILNTILFAFISLAVGKHAEADTTGEVTRLVVVHGATEKSLSVNQLKARLRSETVRFVHPYYEKEKAFEGFPLRSLMNELFDGAESETSNWQIEFTALDGYRATAEWVKLLQSGGYLIFRDIEVPDWEKMKSRQVSPGPFAIVWVGKEQIFKNGFPWPWQIVSMRLLEHPEVK